MKIQGDWLNIFALEGGTAGKMNQTESSVTEWHHHMGGGGQNNLAWLREKATVCGNMSVWIWKWDVIAGTEATLQVNLFNVQFT